MEHNSAEQENFRYLKPSEKRKAKKMFGNTIDLGEVKIIDSGVMHKILTFKADLVTVHNKIYISKEMNDGELIHELYHVWAYSKTQIEPLTALGAHGFGEIGDWLKGRDNSLYYYTLDDFNDPNRRRLKNYNFEQQAAIFEDAYNYLFTKDGRPYYNDEYRDDDGKRRYPYWDEYYENLLEDFKQWNIEIQVRSYSHFMEYN